MAKLRRLLALLSHQPDKLKFYDKRVFDMQEMYRTKNRTVHFSGCEISKLNYG